MCIDSRLIFESNEKILPIATVRNLLIANGCKHALYGPSQRNALGFLRLNTVRGVSQATAQACYINRPSGFASDRERVERLFTLYEAMVAPLLPSPRRKGRRTKAQANKT